MSGFTIGRMITMASAAPDLLAKADEAGPSLRKLAAMGVEVATLMKDPALAEFFKSVEALIRDLDLGGDVPEAEVVTPKEAFTRIAAGDISPDEQRRFDRETQQSGGVG